MSLSGFIEKTEFSFNLEKIRTDICSILENPDYNNFNNQVCLTGTSSTDSPLVGSGSLFYEFDRDHNKILKKNPLQEQDFKYFLDEFKSTYLFEVYNSLIKRYQLGRVRIMTLKPKSCYSYHRDKFQRLHFAVSSEPESCGLIHDKKVYDIPCDGAFYLVNTQLMHTAFNTSVNTSRTHLVADVIREV